MSSEKELNPWQEIDKIAEKLRRISRRLDVLIMTSQQKPREESKQRPDSEDPMPSKDNDPKHFICHRMTLGSESLKDDLSKLFGLPPYDKPNNICRDDAYYAKSLEEKWGKSIKELKKDCGL
jgi:hypothetical protein